jgi:hypothetical protein
MQGMGRILKALLTLVLFAVLGLIGFAYFGDISPDPTEVRQPVELHVGD